MKLRLKSFADPGVLEKERVVIAVDSDDDVGRFAVFLSELSLEGATAGRKTAYWFPDQEVAAGDLVVLYTKGGEDKKRVLESGKTAHFFYWGLSEAKWSDRSQGVVLLEVKEWDVTSPASLSSATAAEKQQ